MKKEIKKLKEFRKWFNKFIKRNYGKECSDFVWSCPVCHAYFVKNLLDDLIETKCFEKQNKESRKIKKKK